jgi:hypothetical protein
LVAADAVHDRDVTAARTALRASTRTLASLGAATALLAGCSSSTPTVDRSDLEQEVSTQLEKEVGTAPDDVACPDDLEGEKGNEMRCTLTAGSDEVGVTVTVTDVDGDDVGFDIVVDDEVDKGALE